MKSFLEFLKESKIDEELDSQGEEIFTIKDGEELISEGSSEDMSFNEIADANMNESEDEIVLEDGNAPKTTQRGFGDEVYVSLNSDSLMKDSETILEKKQDDDHESATLKSLKQQQVTRDDIEELDKIIDRNTNYIIADDGYTLLAKDGKTGERRPLTQEEIDAIVKRKNSTNTYAKKTYFDMDQDGQIITVSKKDPSKKKVLQSRYRKGFLKKLNDLVNDRGIHFNWDGDSARLVINMNSWDDSDKRDNTRFDNIEYGPLSDEDKKLVLDLTAKKEGQAKKDVIGFENGHFTKNGQEMTREELESFVKIMNGMIGGKSKSFNGKSEEEYWESYKISVAGSKVGNAVNFNLPPIKTCHKGELPCAKICYAVKAYGAKPAVRGATECNFALLKRDKNFELFKKSLKYALTTKTRNGGHAFDLCRIHVSGDFYSTDYMQAVCDVAKECPHVRFWAYTKQYEMLHEFGKSKFPENFCMIVSCWGKYNPFDFEGGKYKSLADDFPLAYLDDESEEFNNINTKLQELLGKPKDVQYCPCTMAEQIITRCESCKICFDKSLANNNLCFKLH